MYELLDYALSYAEQKGTNQAEAYFIESRSVSVVVERKEVTSVDSKSDAGMGVRVLLNKSGEFTLGSAYTTSSTMSGIETMVKEAISIAKAKPAQRDLTSFHDRKKVQSVENLFDGRIASVEPTGACRLAKDMIESASLGEQIGSISGDILFLFYRTGLNNSLGIEAGYSSTVLNASCYVTAKNGASIGAAGDDYCSRTFDGENVIEVGRNSASMALSQLNPKPVESGATDLVIGPDAVASLLENTFAVMIRADQIQRKQSPYLGKVGTPIASQAVTIIDQGRHPSAVGSKPYDDEGYPTQTTTVVEKGVLKSFLYNVSSASKEDRESTGNALRPSSGGSVSKYLAEPLVAHTNLTLVPGFDPIDSILSTVRNGIYVRQIIGAHTANRITGEFSVAPLVAYKIEKGEIKHSVKEAMIGGNIQDVLRNATAVGKDVKRCQGTYMDTTIMSPTLKVENASISA